MIYFDELLSIKGKKGLFTIILTALTLIIFEMILFYKIIVEENYQGSLKKIIFAVLSTGTNNNFNVFNNAFAN